MGYFYGEYTNQEIRQYLRNAFCINMRLPTYYYYHNCKSTALVQEHLGDSASNCWRCNISWGDVNEIIKLIIAQYFCGNPDSNFTGFFDEYK